MNPCTGTLRFTHSSSDETEDLGSPIPWALKLKVKNSGCCVSAPVKCLFSSHVQNSYLDMLI